MPQFELKQSHPGNRQVVLRGRTPEDAVRRFTDAPPDATIELQPETGPDHLAGWQRFLVNGQPAGRVRPHHRMRFRRD